MRLGTWTRIMYIIEIAAVSLFAILLYRVFQQSIPYFSNAPLLRVFLTTFLGILTADFLSGMFHWAADTWRSQNWPIIGPTILRSFREHHKKPKDITKHDFFETNGDSCLVGLPILAYTYFSDISIELKAYLATFLTGIALTNQFHQYAHMNKAPLLICILQKCRIVLNKANHQKHHKMPCKIIASQQAGLTEYSARSVFGEHSKKQSLF